MVRPLVRSLNAKAADQRHQSQLCAHRVRFCNMASLLTGVRRCSRWLHKVTHGFAPAGVSQCSGTHRHHSVCFPVGLKHLHTYSLSALPLGSAVTYRLSARPASHAVIGSPGVTQAVWPPSHAPLGRSIALYGSWVMRCDSIGACWAQLGDGHVQLRRFRVTAASCCSGRCITSWLCSVVY